MIPKVRSCVEAVKSGVSRPAPRRRIPHALLLEFFTREGSARW
jgi:acetylglutamate kinase